MIFYILRILREPVRTRKPAGYLIEETEISIFPIFSPIDAEDAPSALRLAEELLPTFRHHIAVQSAKDYHAANPAINTGLARPLHTSAADSVG